MRTPKSAVGAIEYRQVMKCEARNPCKREHNKNQSAVGATEKPKLWQTHLQVSMSMLYSMLKVQELKY